MSDSDSETPLVVRKRKAKTAVAPVSDEEEDSNNNNNNNSNAEKNASSESEMEIDDAHENGNDGNNAAAEDAGDDDDGDNANNNANNTNDNDDDVALTALTKKSRKKKKAKSSSSSASPAVSEHEEEEEEEEEEFQAASEDDGDFDFDTRKTKKKRKQQSSKKKKSDETPKKKRTPKAKPTKSTTTTTTTTTTAAAAPKKVSARAQGPLTGVVAVLIENPGADEKSIEHLKNEVIRNKGKVNNNVTSKVTHLILDIGLESAPGDNPKVKLALERGVPIVLHAFVGKSAAAGQAVAADTVAAPVKFTEVEEEQEGRGRRGKRSKTGLGTRQLASGTDFLPVERKVEVIKGIEPRKIDADDPVFDGGEILQVSGRKLAAVLRSDVVGVRKTNRQVACVKAVKHSVENEVGGVQDKYYVLRQIGKRYKSSREGGEKNVLMPFNVELVGSMHDAVMRFEEIYWDLTRNMWHRGDEFMVKQGKFCPVHLCRKEGDDDSDDEDNSSNSSDNDDDDDDGNLDGFWGGGTACEEGELSVVGSKDVETLLLKSMDSDALRAALGALRCRLPLMSLKTTLIMEAAGILGKVEEIMAEATNVDELKKHIELFRARLPCRDDDEDYPTERDATVAFLKKKSQLLQNLLLLSKTMNLRNRAYKSAKLGKNNNNNNNDDDNNDDNEHPHPRHVVKRAADVIAKMLPSVVTVVELGTPDHVLVSSILERSQHGDVQWEVDSIFEVSWPGDRARRAPFLKLGNKELLWKGVMNVHLAGILDQGLPVPCIELPMTAFPMGRGLSFSDSVHQAIGDTGDDEQPLLLLCDVALGAILHLNNPILNARRPAMKHSVAYKSKEGSTDYVVFDRDQGQVQFVVKLKKKRDNGNHTEEMGGSLVLPPAESMTLTEEENNFNNSEQEE